MTAGLRLLVAAAFLALAGSAAAFVRSTSVRQQPDKGVCLWWSPRTVSYVVNMSTFTGQGCVSGSDASAVAQTAFATWSNASRSGARCTDFGFSFAGPSSSKRLGFDQTPGATNENLVVMRKGQCSDTLFVPANDSCHATPGACAASYNCWEHGGGAITANTLALTTVTFVAATGEIVDSDVELNGWNGVTATPQDGSGGWYYTCGGAAAQTCASNPPYGLSACNWVDVGHVVTHEVGHFIGLDHVCVGNYPAPYNACPSPKAVMAPTTAVGDTANRVLSPDDVDAICTIYPLGAATKTCVAQEPPKSGGGCGTGDGGLLAVAVASLSLAARRRRSR